jgi:hypothetical protein
MTMSVVGTDTFLGGNIKMIADGSVVTYFAGAIKITLDGAPYEALCVDLFHSIGIETISVNPFNPFGTTNGARAAWLYSTQFPSVDSVVEGEAIQLAVWDIIHDSGDGLAAGLVRANTAIGTPTTVLSLANQYISMSVGQTSGDASIYISVNGPSAKQSLMSVYLSPQHQAGEVPEPETFALTGFGLLIAAAYLRRRSRESASGDMAKKH